jgi:hypothetical protein
MAHACPACGYMLPFSLRRTFAQRPVPPQPLEQTAEDRTAVRSEQEAAQHGPLSDALDPAALAPRVPASGRPTRPTLEPISVEDLVAALAADPEVSVPQSRATSSDFTPAAAESLTPGAAHEAPTDALAALGTGALLHGGRYRLLQRFGATKPGSADPPLFLASDARASGERVLVQELPVQLMPPEEAERSLRVAAARLKEARQHTLVPEVLDAFVERGRCFLILSMPGGSRLADVIAREGPLAEPLAVQLGVRLLDALGRFASQTPPLVHGNLCPEHVFVHPNQLVELVGISPSLLTLRSQAGATTTCGIAEYTAPEQRRGLTTEQSDQYAVAAILHTVTARPGILPPSAMRPGASKPSHPQLAKLSEPLEAILERAQHVDLLERFDSADEMRRALLSMPSASLSLGRTSGPRVTSRPATITSGLTPAAAALRATMELPAITKARRKRSKVWPIIMVAALLALLASGVIFGWQVWAQAHHSRLPTLPWARAGYTLALGFVPTCTATTPPVR